jgi:FtsX-like permease family/MacB-like periplasmic core domain
VFRVGWFRFRATLGSRWAGYLAITLLIALLGGIAIGAIAGARRNQSAYPSFLASTDPSALTVPTAEFGLNGARTGYNAALLARISRLPGVERVESTIELNGGVVSAAGRPVPTPPNFDVGNEASVNGLNSTQDRVTVIKGHPFDRGNPNEIMVSPGVAKVLAADGITVGDMLHFILVGNAQASEPGAEVLAHPARRLYVRLVGVGILNTAVIQDDVDRAGSEFFMFNPALTPSLLQCCAASTLSGIQVRDPSREVPTVESEFARLTPGEPHDFFVTAADTAKVERAVKPESIAFAVFGLIAALAALLIAGQAVSRQLRSGAEDLDVLRALGAGPATTTTDGLIGIVGAIVAGALLAGVVAVLLSPLAPIGPVRHVYPSRGVAFDWTALGVGSAVLIVGLSAVAFTVAFRNAPHRSAARAARRHFRHSSAARVAAAAGLPAPAVTGIRFALEPARGRNSVSVRAAIFGAALAMIVVVGTLTFGASLRTLVSRPALYGWNWTYELSGGSGSGAIPAASSAALLDHDHDVAAWTGVYFGETEIDGVSEPVIGGSPNAPVSPPVLSGHGLDARNQIVVGAVTLAQLHKHVGDVVHVVTGTSKPAALRVVGTATMPAVGSEGAELHPTMGTGALLSYSLFPAALLNTPGNSPAGPNAIFVRLRSGVNVAAARRGLDRIATKLSLPTNYGVGVVSVQRPAEIVNYRSMSDTPIILGVGLALGAVGALALTLIASVRQRNRELALLKTLGFTRRQLASVVGWQSTVAVAIGVAIGVPLGIVLGRALWNVFAREIHAVPSPTVPGVSITLVAVGALVLANLVAAIPGRRAARTPTAVLLHAE